MAEDESDIGIAGFDFRTSPNSLINVAVEGQRLEIKQDDDLIILDLRAAGAFADCLIDFLEKIES